MAAEYVCPSCNLPFAYHRDVEGNGSHCECDCPKCAQALVWDEPEVHGGPQTSDGSILTAGPRGCTHDSNRRERESGLVPYLRSG
jgi:hypothetical protein